MPEHKPTLVSPGGSVIHHHDEAQPWEPPRGEENIEQISAHIAAHLGAVETVLHELASDTVHIDVHLVKPHADFPFWRLVTSGMSDVPMNTPPAADVPRFAELLVTLPGQWKLDQAALQDENWYWPVRLLKTLARLPHKFNTWLGFGHTVPNGDPPAPYAASTRLCGAIVIPSVSVPKAFHKLRIDAGKTITFYAAVPIFEEEMNLKLRSGTDALLMRFDRKGISDIVDPSRANVGKKLFGLF